MKDRKRDRQIVQNRWAGEDRWTDRLSVEGGKVDFSHPHAPWTWAWRGHELPIISMISISRFSSCARHCGSARNENLMYRKISGICSFAHLFACTICTCLLCPARFILLLIHTLLRLLINYFLHLLNTVLLWSSWESSKFDVSFSSSFDHSARSSTPISSHSGLNPPLQGAFNNSIFQSLLSPQGLLVTLSS